MNHIKCKVLFCNRNANLNKRQNIEEYLMNHLHLNRKENVLFKMLNVSNLFSKRDEAIKGNRVWDLSSTGCAISDDKLVGNLRFLLQRRTQNFVRFYLRTEDVNDHKLSSIIENQIKSEAGVIHLLRMAKFGIRELANEAHAFQHANIYDYVTSNGIPQLCGVYLDELAGVLSMTNERFVQIIQKSNEVPFVYYALIKYALRVMLQRYVETNGKCEMMA